MRKTLPEFGDVESRLLTWCFRAGTAMDLQQWMQCYAFDVIGNITVNSLSLKLNIPRVSDS